MVNGTKRQLPFVECVFHFFGLVTDARQMGSSFPFPLLVRHIVQHTRAVAINFLCKWHKFCLQGGSAWSLHFKTILDRVQ